MKTQTLAEAGYRVRRYHCRACHCVLDLLSNSGASRLELCPECTRRRWVRTYQIFVTHDRGRDTP